MGPGTGQTLSIRAHHLLCMFGFRGLGYSASFIQNMRTVVESFFSERGAEVELSARCDAICSACPHMLGGECKAEECSEESVRARDRQVLAELGLEVGARLRSPSLARLVADRIDASALQRICAGCGWLPAGYCQQGLERSRQGVQRSGDSSSMCPG